VSTGARVIDAVEQFFEEDLGPATASRASSLNAEQWHALREEVELALRPRADDAKPTGHVRPFVYRSYADRIISGPAVGARPNIVRNPSVILPPLEHLLLYFHSVAVPDHIAPALAEEIKPGLAEVDGRFWLSSALRWLDAAAPLIRSNLLLLCESRVSNREAAQKQQVLTRAVSESDELRVWREMCTISDSGDQARSLPSLRERAYMALANEPHQLDVALWDSSLALETMSSAASDSTDIWLADQSYAPALAEVLRRLNARVDPPANPPSSRLEVMARLSHLSLPAIKRLSVRDLVAIRKNEDLFEEWRSALTAALRELPASGQPTPSQLRTADQSLRESAAYLAERKSRLSRKLLTGQVREFAVAALASATSGAIFGTGGLLAAFTATGAGSVIRTAYGAAGTQRKKQHIESAQRHYAVFAPIDRA
jgi:hypothetical protein